jgi:hypothetical protein
MTGLRIGWLALLVASGLGWQDPAGQGPPRAHVSGRVVDADTGAPVAGALVKVGPRTRLPDRYGKLSVDVSMGVFSESHRFTLTDSEGQFTFEDALPGMVTIAVEASGYLLSTYGQQSPETPVRQVLVGPGERLSGVVVRAWPAGVLTGTVRDEAGEPVVDVRVQALRRTFESGVRRFVPSSEVWTDDRGVYRIAGVDPGDYIVVVESTTVTVPPSRTGDAAAREVVLGLSRTSALASRPQAGVAAAGGHLLTPVGPWLPNLREATALVYPTTYHPNTRRVAQAATVSVEPGRERAGIDVQLAPVRAGRVSGRLTSVAGSPAGAIVRLVAPTGELLGTDAETEVAVTLADDDGSFLLAGVPEGQYVLRVLKESGGDVLIATPEGRSRVETRATPEPTLWAEAPVSVGAGDHLDLTLPLRPGFRVTGYFVFEGSAPAPAREAQLRASGLRLIPADGRSVEMRERMTASADLTFATPRYPPGAYYMAASPIGQWYLKSVLLHGRDVLREPIDLSTADLAGAVVTYSDQTYTLHGNVAGGRPSAEDDPGAVLVVFPARYRAWIAGGMNPLFLHTAITYPDGRFRIPRLIAGEYLVVAYDADARHTPQDPAFLTKIAPLATRVLLTGPDTSGLLINRTPIR